MEPNVSESVFWGPRQLAVATEQPFGLADITDEVAAAAGAAPVDAGCVQVFCPHTTCGLAITELEAGHHADLEALFEQLAPIGAVYAHDDLAKRWQNLEPDERRNGWSHLRALLATSPSVVLPVQGGQVALGRWQRLFLVELDGPRSRQLHVQGWGRHRSQSGPDTR